MAEFGILLYGYNEQNALQIKAVVEGVLGTNIDLISGSAQEDAVIQEILLEGDVTTFEDKETKILMFLGDYSDEQLQGVMRALPREGEVPRPIFCTLTEQNFQWKLTQLIEDLLEEDKYWKEKN